MRFNVFQRMMTWGSFGVEMERRGLRSEDILGMIEHGKEGKK